MRKSKKAHERMSGTPCPFLCSGYQRTTKSLTIGMSRLTYLVPLWVTTIFLAVLVT